MDYVQQAAPDRPKAPPEISQSLNYLESEATTLTMLANKLDEILSRLGRSLPAVPKPESKLNSVSTGHFDTMSRSINIIQDQRQRIAESIQKLGELF